jgi:hypothetical protein
MGSQQHHVVESNYESTLCMDLVHFPISLYDSSELISIFILKVRVYLWLINSWNVYREDSICHERLGLDLVHSRIHTDLSLFLSVQLVGLLLISNLQCTRFLSLLLS